MPEDALYKARVALFAEVNQVRRLYRDEQYVGAQHLAALASDLLVLLNENDDQEQPDSDEHYTLLLMPATTNAGISFTVQLLCCDDCGALVGNGQTHDTRCPGREQVRIR